MARRTKRKAQGSSKKVRSSKLRKSSKEAQGSATKLQETGEAAKTKIAEKIAAQRANKIFPRNLTARAAYLVAGNPVVTRPEDAVANCFPGLELDIRNLDRRFFPGLVFEFVEDGARLAYVDALQDPDLQVDNPEAQRVYKKLDIDPAKAEELYNTLTGDEGAPLAKGLWYLDWIEQKGNRLSMDRARERPLDNSTVWRLVRSLEPGPVTIQLKNETPPTEDSDEDEDEPSTIVLEGWRRRYTDEETGVINGAYQPGELMQGLCSPWQHDFRDCQCFYWAANHPDVVLGELYPGEALPPDDDVHDQPPDAGAKSSPPQDHALHRKPTESGDASPSQGERILASVPLDWIRADRSRALEAEALNTIAENRPYQLDAFKINSAWQDLSVVLEGREIGGLYVPQTIETANPFKSSRELADKLGQTLAPLEVTLTFEYLYAHFSLLSADEARKTGMGLSGAVMLARDRLMLIAVSEMRHLRWVNQILWELFQKGLIPEFKPVLDAAKDVPTTTSPVPDSDEEDVLAGTAAVLLTEEAKKAQIQKDAVKRFIRTERMGGSGPRKMRKAELRPLIPVAIDDFIAVEHPSGFIDGAYARVVATLRQREYPEHMAELALRIASDGVEHEMRFLEIKAALSPFFSPNPTKLPTYLRPVLEATTKDAIEKAEPARALLKEIKESLQTTYILAGNNAIQHSGENISNARKAMTKLLDVGEDLAKQGIGIPFFTFWKSLP